MMLGGAARGRRHEYICWSPTVLSSRVLMPKNKAGSRVSSHNATSTTTIREAVSGE